MPSTINAQTSPFAAIVTSADATGNLALQTANVTAVTLDTNQNATFANTVSATTFVGSANASSLSTGTVPTARLASGTANSSTFLRGDQTWATVTQTRISGGTTGLTPNTLTGGDVTLAGTLAVANGGTGATSLSSVTVGNATNLSTNRTNWSTNGTISAVVGQLAWKNYGNSHTIFDASAGTSPDGTAVNNTNPQNNWTGTFPTLMGWNGAGTYGVRVDSARIADSASSVSSDAVGAATAALAAGGVGTYIFANASTNLSYNGTIAGSSITPNGWVSTAVGANNTILASAAGSALSGTWRIMGNATGSNWRATLLLRIS